MKFGALQRRVKRCEQVMAVRMAETEDNWTVLSQVWRQGWSPLRIITVGLAGGFLAGKLEVPGKVNGARWLQMIGSVSNLFASGQAAFAAAMAAHAADTADEAADQADEAAEQMAPQAAARPAPRAAATPEPELREPQPAEAATDVSER
ncbi:MULTISPECIES: protein sip-5 [Stenotrophomonas]|uniref:protein sip-5 n=1 Tax=Stenotrophomonas TaxID=40323 RepID=UPI0009A21B86|nr:MULTISPECIES: protein sip-5 [Stenotrophomonas]AWH35543.1 protein sip-5 [Stenotrophomonas sp. ZAC14D1_NAIMI4_6]AWH39673.1 protein sip-5 [Stenotrophomonas sp. ZAC14D1_NAIMI4_1]AWH44392.1 protein sip-5 [Stenotrophomonas sp. ZAC14A_NAIMI4_1]MBK0054310.1 protein sip-5 [Stenotrophomonas sp. S39]